MDEMNKSEVGNPPPVVAATFTHSILIESMSYSFTVVATSMPN